MREETRAILREMETWPWFEHVGELINQPGVITVGSWDEAVEPDRSYVWECLTLQVNNVIHQAVNRRDWHRAQGLNSLVGEVKLVLEPLFKRIRAFGSSLSLPEDTFYGQVTWDLVGIGMETEYADLFPPLFSRTLLRTFVIYITSQRKP